MTLRQLLSQCFLKIQSVELLQRMRGIFVMRNMNTALKASILAIGIILAVVLNVYHVDAKESCRAVSGKGYELLDANGFSVSGKGTSTLCFGRESIGQLSLQGTVVKTSTYEGYTAYGATDVLSMSYTYDGAYQEKDKSIWNLTSSDEKMINGYPVDKKIDMGAILVQRSQDGKTWEAAYSDTNIFAKRKKLEDSVYNISMEDIKEGTFYRVYVAYRMKQKTGEEKHGLIKKEVYQYKNFVEQYDIYVCYGKSAVEVRDISTGNNAGTSVSNGFVIDKCGANCKVTVSKNNGRAVEVESLTAVTDAGAYKIEITNNLNQSFIKNVRITGGMDFSQVVPTVYEGEKKEKYEQEKTTDGSSALGMPSFTKLRIGYPENTQTITSNKNGYDAYGIAGDKVELYLELPTSKELKEKGLEVIDDNFGKKEKELIEGVQTGEVDSGALIVQKSLDGKKWETVEQNRYTNGFFTTDFYNNYGNKGDICIYTPDGNDVIGGVYIRVIYAHSLKHVDAKKADRYMEVYEFYLCSNELGAVTFHNLTVTKETIKDIIGEDNDDSLELYKDVESLQSGSGTATGFIIDTSKNSAVTYTVKRNGRDIAIPTDGKYTKDGKYDILLKSAVGNSEKVTIYVDKSNSEEALERYFGSSFISGKRIFEEGNYPVFEGGKTEYATAEIPDEYLPVSGTIENTTTGEKIEIGTTRKIVKGALSVPGDYVATFSTRQAKNGEALHGDWRVFTFRFRIIPEGMAPGPVVNENSLLEYAKSTTSDAYPMYYGLIYGSAGGGIITEAFSTWEAAKEYAYNYEKGTVEKQSDGTYRYVKSFNLEQKDKYVSAWDLTDILNQSAEEAIQVSYFDMSDKFTYVTLDEDYIDVENKRTLELKNSVVLFANDTEKEKLCAMVDALPIISRKPWSSTKPGTTSNVKDGYVDFEFVKDKYEVDSSKVVITDCNDKEYEIEYHKGVGQQLSEKNCPSGVVTITESTCYGDTNVYQAVYIAEHDNTSTLEIEYYEGKKEEHKTFSKADNGTTFEVDAFKIEKLVDELDPYSLVTVEKTESYEPPIRYVADQEATYVWTQPGIYKVSVTNRLGYSYSINVKVVESEYATLLFKGEGTQGLEVIFTAAGEKNVKLPELTRYGYEFVGFEAEDGTVYTNKIASIAFRGETVLNAIWKAKEYELSLQDTDGNTYKTMAVEFGRSYELEAYDTGEGKMFVGWLQDGKVMEDNRITITEEKDIILTASVKDAEETINTPGVTVEEKAFNWIFVAFIILIAVAVGTVLVFRQKNRPNKKNQD